MPRKLRPDRWFQPCPTEPGDELYPNGVFEFNITRLLGFISAHPERFPIEAVELTAIPKFGSDDRLDGATVQAADVSRPILLAEIAPGLQRHRRTSPGGESPPAARPNHSCAPHEMSRPRAVSHVGTRLRDVRRVLEFEASAADQSRQSTVERPAPLRSKCRLST
jgi:hypothetical protein